MPIDSLRSTVCGQAKCKPQYFIQRHALEQMAWLDRQIKSFPAQNQLDTALPTSPRASGFLSTLAVVPDHVKIDAEAGRIAYVWANLRYFGPGLMVWLLTMATAGSIGENWRPYGGMWASPVVRVTPAVLFRDGVVRGYWSQDKTRKRIYLTGQVKLAAQLVRKAMELTNQDIIGTNLPGRRRVAVSLAGSLQEASARLYAAWFASKDPQQKGTVVSRETLCMLWQVSVPTLLAWERIAGIKSQANYAQQNNTAIDHVPHYAYLTLNRDGSYAAAWRLPNTYTRQRPDDPATFAQRQGKANKTSSLVTR